MTNSSARFTSLVRNFVFGVEDSLVSTVGLLAGIAVAGVSQSEIIIAGIVLIFVEAFSMGVGSLLSEHAAKHAAERNTDDHAEPLTKSIRGGAIMFFSYFFAGFIPLVPYLLLIGRYAIVTSIFISLLSLFVLGFGSGRYSRTNSVREGLEMLVIGGLAVLIGVVVGTLLGFIG